MREEYLIAKSILPFDYHEAVDRCFREESRALIDDYFDSVRKRIKECKLLDSLHSIEEEAKGILPHAYHEELDGLYKVREKEICQEIFDSAVNDLVKCNDRKAEEKLIAATKKKLSPGYHEEFDLYLENMRPAIYRKIIDEAIFKIRVTYDVRVIRRLQDQVRKRLPEEYGAQLNEAMADISAGHYRDLMNHARVRIEDADDFGVLDEWTKDLGAVLPAEFHDDITRMYQKHYRKIGVNICNRLLTADMGEYTLSKNADIARNSLPRNLHRLVDERLESLRASKDLKDGCGKMFKGIGIAIIVIICLIASLLTI